MRVIYQWNYNHFIERLALDLINSIKIEQDMINNIISCYDNSNNSKYKNEQEFMKYEDITSLFEDVCTPYFSSETQSKHVKDNFINFVNLLKTQVDINMFYDILFNLFIKLTD